MSGPPPTIEPRRNVAVAPWFRGLEPTVTEVDEHMLRGLQLGARDVRFPPTSVGWWWSADGAWHGPYGDRAAALTAGRDALKRHAAARPR